MPDATLSNWTLYIEIAAGFAALGLAVLLTAVFRRPLRGRGSLSRPALPAAFILVALAFTSDAARRLLPVRERFFDFVRAGLVFFAVVFIVCLVDACIQAWFKRRKARYPVPGVLHGFILAVFYLVLVFMILKGILGINITPFLATSAILTAVIGLALQGVLGNILAGLSLHFTRSFSRGDWVKIGETEGIVMETNWRETRILDRASNMVVLPNNAVASGTITNFSQPDPKAALTLPLKVGYEAAPALVLVDPHRRRARGSRMSRPRRRLWPTSSATMTSAFPICSSSGSRITSGSSPSRPRSGAGSGTSSGGWASPSRCRSRASWPGSWKRSTGAGRKRRRRRPSSGMSSICSIPRSSGIRRGTGRARAS